MTWPGFVTPHCNHNEDRESDERCYEAGRRRLGEAENQVAEDRGDARNNRVRHLGDDVVE